MLKAEKAYEIYFFSDYISYYLKDFCNIAYEDDKLKLEFD